MTEISIWHVFVVALATDLATGLGALPFFFVRDFSVRWQGIAYAIAGGMIGTIVWYGMFVTLGEMYFNMWQTEIGLGSVAGAFRYGTVCAVMTFLIAMRDD